MVHAGTKLYGRVGKCGPSCVATLFFHVGFVPLVPLRSFLIFEEHGDGRFDAVRIPFRAWLKAALLDTAERRAQQRVYVEFARYAVDVALLPREQQDELRAKLRHALAEHARMKAVRGAPYREAGVDPEEDDPRILRAALTLARLDGDDALHERIWRKLRALTSRGVRRAECRE